MTTIQVISVITLALAAAVLTLIAAVIIVIMSRAMKHDRLANFLFEIRTDGKPGKPSVSRLQMLIWNFVVAFAFLYVLGINGIESAIKGLLQPEVLVLLGISNTTYLLGKRTGQPLERPQVATAETAAERAGQPKAAGEVAAIVPGPEGTQ